ncbi:MAG: FkbM family methyltransferase, partial [Blastocatellia bacterium]
IDEFASNARPPTAIKINAEGAEMEVLAGGQETIGKFKPLIFLSTHSEELHRGCWELLRSCGYSPNHISSDKVWAEATNLGV